ncbi:hypothetical protein [Chlorogloeopsis sp. ULAP02]|uniref:hypothetical protein n=1 Tax=Chlorogloeopsis sp. ULAP02 TaxID=3107926 RepID=UPI0031353A73
MEDQIVSQVGTSKLSVPLPPPNHFLLGKIGQTPIPFPSIQQMMRDAHARKISVHIRVGEVPRFRIGGQMVVTPQIFEAYLSEILTPLQRQQFIETKELDTAIFYPGFLRCRINCFEKLSS